MIELSLFNEHYPKFSILYTQNTLPYDLKGSQDPDDTWKKRPTHLVLARPHDQIKPNFLGLSLPLVSLNYLKKKKHLFNYYLTEVIHTCKFELTKQ